MSKNKRWNFLMKNQNCRERIFAFTLAKQNIIMTVTSIKLIARYLRVFCDNENNWREEKGEK